MWKSSFDIFHECCSCRDKSLHWYWYSLSRQCFKPAVTVTSESELPLMMAYHHNYMMPMFSVPQVTWANQSIGQTSVGRFPNPKSVMRICKYLVFSGFNSDILIVLTKLWQLDLVLAVGWIIQESQQCNARHFFSFGPYWNRHDNFCISLPMK